MSLIKTKIIPIDENESKVVMEISFMISKNHHLGDIQYGIDTVLARFGVKQRGKQCIIIKNIRK